MLFWCCLGGDEAHPAMLRDDLLVPCSSILHGRAQGPHTVLWAKPESVKYKASALSLYHLWLRERDFAKEKVTLDGIQGSLLAELSGPYGVLGIESWSALAHVLFIAPSINFKI